MTITHKGGFESGIFGPHNWAGKHFNGNRIKLVSDEVRTGDKAIRVEVRNGDKYINSQERAELNQMLDGSGKKIFEGTHSGTKYFGFSVRLDKNWKSPDKYGIIWQLHETSDSPSKTPPFSFRAEDKFYIRTNAGDVSGGKVNAKKFYLSDGSLDKGKWVDFIVKMDFSTSKSGEIDVWRRDEGEAGFDKVLDVDTPTVQSASGNAIRMYHKTGLYRDSGTDHTNVLHLDGFVRGDNFNEVKATFSSGGKSAVTSTTSGGDSSQNSSPSNSKPSGGSAEKTSDRSSGQSDLSFEAEDAKKSGSFAVRTDKKASDGAYVEATKNFNGKLRFDIKDADAGKYKLSADVFAPNHGDNSFFVKVNGGSKKTWHINPEDGWQDATFKGNITLKDGANTLEILAREDDTGIDTVDLSLLA